jgi:hypothetical protein
VTAELKTPRDWEDDPKYTFVVMDPDGWRFHCGPYAPRSFDDPITREEYEARSVPSTVMDKREATRLRWWKRSAKEESGDR